MLLWEIARLFVLKGDFIFIRIQQQSIPIQISVRFGNQAMYRSILSAPIRTFPQADGALQGSAGHGIAEIREQILGVVSTVMWGEFNGAGMFVSKC